ncbi:hypothetical protein [Schleiferilactobacillus perolens]|uniref:hypothetical protein n=1 Tax=Schleiferilactobacillus perolens TaxID=100468 RepID=UPI0023539625|nr:hypothetical protein [Schleiferilactobacillus perolens]MCI2171674.1 hypothetical protein [Schleiferilactobacillus perolens]
MEAAMQQIYGHSNIKKSLQEAESGTNKTIQDTNRNNATILKKMFSKCTSAPLRGCGTNKSTAIFSNGGAFID